MAEISVENQTCKKCGVDIRPNTLFCYNCGASVAPEEMNGNRPSSADFQNKSVKEKKASKIKSRTVSKKHIKDLEQTASFETTKFKSAASLRQKSKPAQKKSIEVIWEEPENAPNVWFLAVAFLLTLFAVGILFAMLYIR